MLSGICRAFFARCLACADDANRFFVILHSSGINNKDDPADKGQTDSYGSKLRLRVFNVIVVQPTGIGEDSSRYTLITALGQLAPVLQSRSWCSLTALSIILNRS